MQTNIIKIYGYMIEYQIMDHWASTIDIIMARNEREAMQRLEDRLDVAVLILNVRKTNPTGTSVAAYYYSRDDYF